MDCEEVNDIGLFSKKVACDCGMNFGSQQELMAHAAQEHGKGQSFKCNCGTSFDSKAELQAHAKKAHKM